MAFPPSLVLTSSPSTVAVELNNNKNKNHPTDTQLSGLSCWWPVAVCPSGVRHPVSVLVKGFPSSFHCSCRALPAHQSHKPVAAVARGVFSGKSTQLEVPPALPLEIPHHGHALSRMEARGRGTGGDRCLGSAKRRCFLQNKPTGPWVGSKAVAIAAHMP